jgi:hypothetical protein
MPENDDILMDKGKTLQQTKPAPKLQLADGTDTNVSTDTSVQSDSLAPVKAKFKFMNGNYDRLDDTIKELSNKLQTIRQTIIPLLGAGMIELLGSDSSIQYDTFSYSYAFSNNNSILVKVEVILKTQEWIGTDTPKSAVDKDAKYILDKLRVVQNIDWEHCIIDTADGSLTLNFTI